MRISDWSSDVCSSDLHFDENACRLEHGIQLELMISYETICVFGRAMQADQRGGRTPPMVAFGYRTLMVSEQAFEQGSSEERSVGQECVSTCRSRWSAYNENKNKIITEIIKTTS